MRVLNNLVSRRAALLGGAATAAVGLGSIRRASAQVIRTGGGIGGGGLVKASEEQARAHFSLAASRFELESGDEFAFAGAFQWVDNSADIRIVSQTIEFYGPVEGEADNYREVRGTAKIWSLDDETWSTPDTSSGEIHSFLVQATDSGDGPGTGNDEIAVFIGDEGAEDPTADPLYTLSGKIDSGDIEIFEFTLPF
jgi:hypothetical protein